MKKEEEEEEDSGDDGYTCACPLGFKLTADKKTCKKEHPCDRKNNGGCTGICKKDGDKASCKCDIGFELLADKMTCAPGTKFYEYVILRCTCWLTNGFNLPVSGCFFSASMQKEEQGWMLSHMCRKRTRC